MANPPDGSKAPQSRAQAAFSASAQRDLLVRQEIEKSRAATDAKTAKLKALRLAKEAEDKAAGLGAPEPKTRKRRKPA